MGWERHKEDVFWSCQDQVGGTRLALIPAATGDYRHPLPIGL